MNQRTDYPCNQALDDLEAFFYRHIQDPSELQRFLGYLDECRKEARMGFRFIHTELMNYRKNHSDYFPFTDDERKMIDELLYFWA